MKKISDIMEQIKDLEKILSLEIQKKEEEFFYKVHGKEVRFEEAAKRYHKTLVIGIRRYLLNASLLNVLTAPVIWFCLVPVVLLDLITTLYQAVCFPVYNIPKVRRRDYIVIDRHTLGYLNAIEKLNCVYCGYVNGLIAYAQEIVARTEQYWCPIKHARKIAGINSRYSKFFEYGDGKAYRERIEQVRRDYDDLK